MNFVRLADLVLGVGPLTESDRRPVVSFDFDGVLHKSVAADGQPFSYWDYESWDPDMAMHAKLRKEAKTNRVVVITKRGPVNYPTIWMFIDRHDLPVSAVHFTSLEPKWPILDSLGAIRHYDDSQSVAEELAGKDIDFVMVRRHT